MYDEGSLIVKTLILLIKDTKLVINRVNILAWASGAYAPYPCPLAWSCNFAFTQTFRLAF